MIKRNEYNSRYVDIYLTEKQAEDGSPRACHVDVYSADSCKALTTAENIELQCEWIRINALSIDTGSFEARSRIILAYENIMELLNAETLPTTRRISIEDVINSENNSFITDPDRLANMFIKDFDSDWLDNTLLANLGLLVMAICPGQTHHDHFDCHELASEVLIRIKQKLQ